MFGTDFSLMEGVFKRRSRQDLKAKFKREERSNRGGREEQREEKKILAVDMIK